jgi:hypothetical protein
MFLGGILKRKILAMTTAVTAVTVRVTVRLAVSKPVILGVGSLSGLMTGHCTLKTTINPN